MVLRVVSDELELGGVVVARRAVLVLNGIAHAVRAMLHGDSAFDAPLATLLGVFCPVRDLRILLGRPYTIPNMNLLKFFCCTHERFSRSEWLKDLVRYKHLNMRSSILESTTGDKKPPVEGGFLMAPKIGSDCKVLCL